jgi:hypothetical protein
VVVASAIDPIDSVDAAPAEVAASFAGVETGTDQFAVGPFGVCVKSVTTADGAGAAPVESFLSFFSALPCLSLLPAVDEALRPPGTLPMAAML